MNNRLLVFCIQAIGAIILVVGIFHGTGRWIALAVVVVFESFAIAGEVRKLRGTRGR